MRGGEAKDRQELAEGEGDKPSTANLKGVEANGPPCQLDSVDKVVVSDHFAVVGFEEIVFPRAGKFSEDNGLKGVRP